MNERASPVVPQVVEALGGAQLLGVSERTYAELRKRPGFPRPIALLTARNPRWRVADLLSWLDRLPELDQQPEPAQLRRGKKAKLAAREARLAARGGTTA